MAYKASLAHDVKSLRLDTTPWRIPTPHKRDDHPRGPHDAQKPVHPLYYNRPEPLSPETDFVDVASEELLDNEPEISQGRVTNDPDSDDGLSLPRRRRASLRSTNGEKAQARNRRSSVTFNPNATLECGTQHDITSPLKKEKERGAPTSNPKIRGRSMMDEFAMAVEGRNRQRNHSESERDTYSQQTGEKVSSRRAKREQAKYRVGEGRFPLLQTTVDQLARDGRERAGSLTSESSWSQALETASLPPDAQREYFQLPTEFPAGATDIAALQRSGTFAGLSPVYGSSSRLANRSLSYYMDRKGSMRRHKQGSFRSASSSMSPAGSFLSNWVRDDASSVADPDEEGQEICGNSGYIIGRQIGYGGFSIVKEAYSLSGEERSVRAVKIVRKNVSGRSELDNEKVQAEFEHEISIWRHLKHPYVLPLLEVFQDNFATYCITSLYTGGTLFDLVASRRKLARTNSAESSVSPILQAASNTESKGISPKLAKRYIFQLASAIRYLHQDVRIVHRDIKLENCLLDVTENSSGNISLCDFGMADFISREDRDDLPYDHPSLGNGETYHNNIGPSSTSSVISGSITYASPELFEASKPVFATHVDIWAFGVSCYTLLTGALPFSHTFTPRLQMLIARGEWNVEALHTAAGSEAVSLIKSCLDLDVTRRATIEDVLRCGYLDGQAERLALEVKHASHAT